MTAPSVLRRQRRYLLRRRIRLQDQRDWENHERKVHFASIEAAEARIAALPETDRDRWSNPVEAYACPICGEYLIGHRSLTRAALLEELRAFAAASEEVGPCSD